MASSGAEIAARLRERIEAAAAAPAPALTQMELARLVGRSRQSITAWKKGETEPDLATFARLCEALSVSADDLLGLPSTRAATPPVDPDAPIEQAWIPLVADVAAGEPMLAPREEAEDWYSFKARWVEQIARRHGTPIDRMFAVKVARGFRGESMLPTIRPGASLVVDPGPVHSGLTAIDDGRIYVCRPDGGDGWTVKRAWLAGGGRHLVLKGDNPEQPAIVEDMKGRRLRDVIVGKVVYIGQEEE